MILLQNSKLANDPVAGSTRLMTNHSAVQTPTDMRREIDETPEAVSRMLEQSGPVISQAAEALRDMEPSHAVTVARGSSDHAALFLKYAIEITFGVPVASLGPSLASVYGAPLHLSNAAALCISQSGKSPDIVAMAETAGDGGALSIALCNTTPSPLSDACMHAIDLQAGPENSVAATKTYICSIAAGLAVLAGWAKDASLDQAVQSLPEHLERAIKLDWAPLADVLDQAESIYVLGRGPISAIAHEAALKFKETCGFHAEAYSTAEVFHGPVEIVGSQFPVLAFAARDKAEATIADTADQLARRGARVFIPSNRAKHAQSLPFVATGHPLTDALVPIISFYGFVEALSRARGRNPDKPLQLRKVTETI